MLALAMVCSNFVSVASFTTTTPLSPVSNNFLSHNIRIATISSTSTCNHEVTALKMAQSDIDGTKTGAYFMAVVLIANVWLFSIPTEFRRAHIYPEGNAGLYTDPKAMTASDWANGVAEYYKSGGGINFDFSIEGRE